MSAFRQFQLKRDIDSGMREGVVSYLFKTCSVDLANGIEGLLEVLGSKRVGIRAHVDLDG